MPQQTGVDLPSRHQAGSHKWRQRCRSRALQAKALDPLGWTREATPQGVHLQRLVRDEALYEIQRHLNKQSLPGVDCLAQHLQQACREVGS